MILSLRRLTAASLFLIPFVMMPPAAQAQDGPVAISIPQIQGSGSESPYNGKKVTTEGIVTGDFQEKEQLKGFFVQDPKGDGDPKTSDGLFVYVLLGNKLSKIDVKVGDQVRVSGTIAESGQQTQLEDATEITVLGHEAVPAPTSIALPLPAGQNLEQYEDMLVAIPQSLTVTDNYRLSEAGQLMLAADGRMVHPGMVPPGSPTNEEAGGLPLPSRLIMLDDGMTAHHPSPVPYLSDQGTRRVGDTIAGLTGVISYDSGEYCIQPTQAPQFTSTNPRTAAPAPVGGNLRIAAFNVMNYFTTLSSEDKQARGAGSPEEFARQSTKTVAALKAMDADIVGLMEVQNNGAKTIDDLVTRLNAAYGGTTYAAVPAPPQGLGSDLIRVDVIYKTAKVQLLGPSITDTAPAYDRFPLAQRFAPVAGPKTSFLVVVNHLKSRSTPRNPGDIDMGNIDTGAGAWNRKRVQQAQAEAVFIKSLQKDLNEPRALVIGDFNAYAEEAPIRALKAKGFLALEDALPPAERYSFIFQGRSGSIDHALASPALQPLVTGITIWHINADEPAFLAYSNPAATAAPYRSSDHDPVILGLNLN